MTSVEDGMIMVADEPLLHCVEGIFEGSSQTISSVHKAVSRSMALPLHQVPDIWDLNRLPLRASLKYG